MADSEKGVLDEPEPEQIGATLESFRGSSNAGAIIDFARDASRAEPITIQHGDLQALLLMVPRGRRVVDTKEFLDARREAPERREGTAELKDLDSFIAHVKRFADSDSALFCDANEKAPVLVCVFDYHRQGGEGSPRFGKHRARYSFPLSEEWVAWQAKNGLDMSQKAFATFVEDRIADVANPSVAPPGVKEFVELVGAELASPSRLLELSRGLSLNVNRKVSNAVNPNTGEGQLVFAEEHRDTKGESLRVPGAFMIAIPIFRLAKVRNALAARLRYSVEDHAVVWKYQLYRVAENFDDAIREACGTAQKETGLPLFYGSPERAER